MKTLFTFILVLTVNLALAQISITMPIQNSVLQRNNSNSANVGIAGQALSNTTLSFVTIQYRIQQLSPQNSAYLSTPINWTTKNCDYGGLYNFTVSLPGGWYQLDVKSSVTGTQIASVKFGVGEVFIIAGQSNAQGVTSSNMYYSTPYDGVIADLHQENTGCLSDLLPLYPSLNKLTVGSPIAPQGPNNWCYTVLGNQLVDNSGVPVAFFNAAQSGTGVRNWVESIQNPNGYTYSSYNQQTAICSNGGTGHPYIALKKTMQFYGSLFGSRSILWHQGENDAHDANAGQTNGSTYITQLRTVINQARSDFGHSDLSWWICKVSRTDAASETVYQTNADILSAQGTVQTDSYNKVGPYTDGIGPRNASDHIHFTDAGLYDLGNAWNTNIGGATLTSATPASPNGVLHVGLFGTVSTGFSVQAGNDYAQYYWFDTNAVPFYGTPTGQTLSGLSGGGAYQCYARHANGQWYVSPIVRVPSQVGPARIGVSSETEDFLRYSVAPNPVTDKATIRFTLTAPAQVNLSLIDASGKVVKQLVNGHHGEGSFAYPVDMSSFQPGLYVCNLVVNDVHLTRKLVKQAK